MRYTVSAPDAPLHAGIQLPASKSISNRALILHALAHGKQTLHNLSDCDDTRVMVRALQGNPEHIDIMAAGTAMRFLTAYLSVTPGARVITGTQRMQQRPIRILVDALRQLGADIKYTANEGFPPLHITGSELQGNEISLAGNVSSQYISALLMIGAVLPKGLHLHLTGNIISRPYINLTLQLIHDFGGDAQWSSENTITVHPGGYQDVPFTVESDWSAASYWYQILALRGNEKRRMKNEESLKSYKEETIELSGLFPHPRYPSRRRYGRHSRPCTDLCRDLLPDEYPFPFHRFAKSQNKGDRPYHRPHHRTAQIRLCGAFRTGQHPAMEWRTLSGRERSPYRYLRRPPHGNGVCSCLHHIAAAND